MPEWGGIRLFLIRRLLKLPFGNLQRRLFDEGVLSNVLPPFHPPFFGLPSTAFISHSSSRPPEQIPRLNITQCKTRRLWLTH